MGKRPCSSGIRSEGFDMWNAPEAMNRMWSVLTMPYLVLTVQPSTSGSRSRCTPSRETSAPTVSPRRQILSSSSRKTMPFCSALTSAWARSSSSFTRRAASSSTSALRASRIFILRARVRSPPMFWNICCSCCVISSMPGGPMISMFAGSARSSTSISRSSRLPSRSILRNFWRVSASRGGSAACMPMACGRGSSASRTRSSAASSARWRTFAISVSRVSFTATSTRSLMIESTSRPT